MIKLNFFENLQTVKTNSLPISINLRLNLTEISISTQLNPPIVLI